MADGEGLVVYVCPECGKQAVDDGLGTLELLCHPELGLKLKCLPVVPRSQMEELRKTGDELHDAISAWIEADEGADEEGAITDRLINARDHWLDKRESGR